MSKRLSLMALILLIFTLVAPTFAERASSSEGTFTRVSVSSSGEQGNMHSDDATISANGRHVAFASFATNLVPGDTNNRADIFVHDLWMGETSRVSIMPSGEQFPYDCYKPVISPDGQWLAFTHGQELYLHDRESQQTIAIVENRLVDGAYLSFDAHYTVYSVFEENGLLRIYDRLTGTTSPIGFTPSDDPIQGTASTISNDGRFIAFASGADDIVPGDINRAADVFLHDRQTGETIRISVTSSGGNANSYSDGPHISGDGQFVAYRTNATNIGAPGNRQIDVMLYDREANSSVYTSMGSWQYPSISADGRYTANHAGQVYDQQTSQIETIVSNWGQGHVEQRPYLSGDGRYLTFRSPASDFVPDDTEGWRDIFVYDRWPEQPRPTAAPTVTVTPTSYHELLLPLILR